MKYMYQSEKFSTARRSLMLPHPGGEAASIVAAYNECSLGLHDLNEDGLDEHPRDWIRRLRELMDTTGLNDPAGIGTWALKAERMTEGEKFDLSRVIDDLANWFDRKFWERE